MPAAYLASGIPVSTSRTALVAPDDPGWARYLKFAEAFGIPEDLVVVVSGPEVDRHTFLDRVAEKVRAQPDVASVLYRIDPEPFASRQLYYLDDAAFGQLDAWVRLPEVQQLLLWNADRAEGSTLAALARLIDVAPAQAGKSMDVAQGEGVWPIVDAWANQLERAAGTGSFDLDLGLTASVAAARAEALQQHGLDSAGYLSSASGDLGVMFVRPNYVHDEMTAVEPFVLAVRAACEAARSELGIEYGLTGIPASQVEEMETIERDTKLTSAIALIGVVILFLLYVPEPRLLLASLIPIAFGIVWAAAGIRVLFGSVNLMSSIFLVVLIGMGIDFSVHLVLRAIEASAEGLESRAAVALAMAGAGRGIVTGGLTSAGAFLSVGWCGFRGIEELGIAAALGLIFTLSAAMTVLPACLVLLGPRLRVRRHGYPFMRTWARVVTQRARPIFLVGALSTLGLAYFATRVPFDFSLLRLLPAQAESAKWMEIMSAQRDLSPNVIIALSPDMDRAREKELALAKLPSVYRSVSIAAFIAPHGARRVDAIGSLRGQLDAPKPGDPVALTEALRDLEASLESLAELLFDRAHGSGVDEVEAAAEAIGRVRQALEDPSRQREIADRVAVFERSMATSLAALGDSLRAQARAEPPRMDGLPKPLQQRFVGKDGSFAVYATPQHSVWNRDALGAFVNEVRTVDPNVTGFPETFYENSGRIRDGFRRASVYAAIAVLLLLLIDLKRPKLVALAVIPVLCGSIWMLATMSLTGLAYNLANVVGLPLIMGVGIDNGVHLLHRHRQSGDAEVATTSTGGAVLLSSLTTMIGFGSLALASHRGYRSLGQILFVGIGACLAAALTMLPAALAGSRARRGRHS